MKHYEFNLPSRYAEAAYVCFDRVKTGFLYDFKAVLPGIFLSLTGWILVKPTVSQLFLALGILAASVYPYFSLHELLHGAVVKVMTGQRVEIGFNRSGASCGMPQLYLYRHAAVCCTAAPLVVFSLLLGLGTVLLIAADHWLFLPLSLLLTLHLLGCRSDVSLLKELKKIANPSLLVKDTGNEQWFYLPQEERVAGGK